MSWSQYDSLGIFEIRVSRITLRNEADLACLNHCFMCVGSILIHLYSYVLLKQRPGYQQRYKFYHLLQQNKTVRTMLVLHYRSTLHWQTFLRQNCKYIIRQPLLPYDNRKLRMMTNVFIILTNMFIWPIGSSCRNDEPRLGMLTNLSCQNDEYILQYDKLTVFFWEMRLTNLFLSFWRSFSV
jgi:hypothetical protein